MHSPRAGMETAIHISLGWLIQLAWECTQHNYFLSHQNNLTKKVNSHSSPKNQAKTKKSHWTQENPKHKPTTKPNPNPSKPLSSSEWNSRNVCATTTWVTLHTECPVCKAQACPQDTTPQAEFVTELSSASPCIFFPPAINSQLLLSTPMLCWPKYLRSMSRQVRVKAKNKHT